MTQVFAVEVRGLKSGSQDPSTGLASVAAFRPEGIGRPTPEQAAQLGYIELTAPGSTTELASLKRKATEEAT